MAEEIPMGKCIDCAQHPDTNHEKPSVPMGKGPGGSNDISEPLGEATRQFKSGEINKSQFIDRMDYYAPKK